MHITPYDIRPNKFIKTQRRKFLACDKFVVVIRYLRGIFFHLVSEIVQEGTPARGWAELWDVVCVHWGAFVGDEDEASVRDGADVVDVERGFHGDEGVAVCCGPELYDFIVCAED